MDGLTIRTATADDLDLMIEWAAREGWNPGGLDATPFRAADPDGFLVAMLDGAMAACISVVAYDAAFGFLGFYICRPDLRGRGIGWALWRAGMERLGNRTVGLDGVLAQQANYAKSGFVLAHRNVRFAGSIHPASEPNPAIRGITDELITDVIAFDAAYFGRQRPAFLRSWLDLTGGRVGVAWIEDGRVRGYGVSRPAGGGVNQQQGYSKVGPLFAESPDIASELLNAMAVNAYGLPTILDCPEPNAAAIDLASRSGLKPVFETARMYKGPAPELPLDRIFGITSFELG